MPKSLTCLLLLAGALCAAAAGSQDATFSSAEIEPLLGTRIHARGIVFQVRSNGCTRKADFEVQIFGSEPLQLLLVRNRPDLCEALVPYGKRIRFSHAELGLEDGSRIRILNPLGEIRLLLTD